MDPSFSKLSHVIHEERLQAAEKYRRFRPAEIPGEETSYPVKWIVFLVMLGMLALGVLL